MELWISRRLYTSSRASPRRSHAHPGASPFVRCVVSRRSPCLGSEGRTLTLVCRLYHSPPRSITPRPDSIPSPPRPIAVPRPRRPQIHSSPCEFHVAAIAEASHSYTCCAYTTHAASSPHTRTRISTHASTRTCRICPPKNFPHKDKGNKHHHPCLAGLCFPCPSEWPPRGTHTCMHPCRTKRAQLHVHFCASVLTGQEFPSSSSSSSSPCAAIVVQLAVTLT